MFFLLLSGTSILKDGHTFFEEYGRDLDHLNEGDRIGVIRKASGALHFYVNGDDQGAAVQSIPERVWVVVDMYGKCAEVAIVGDVNRDTSESLLHCSFFAYRLFSCCSHTQRVGQRDDPGARL